MPKPEQFVGHWVTWKDDNRFEQELYADGTFEAVIFDDDDRICHAAIGTWQIQGDSVLWRYTKGGPKYVDKNKLLSAEVDRFSLREGDGTRVVFYRGVKGSIETSANFDSRKVRSFLKRLSALVDSGFGTAQVNALAREIRKMRRERSRQYVFQIGYQGANALLGIRAFMDDVEAPDLYFYAPLKLIREINKHLEKLND